MGSIPNFTVNPPQIPSSLDQYGKMLQLKALMGQQELLPLQVEEQEQKVQQEKIATQMQQLQLQTQQGRQKFWSNPEQFMPADDEEPDHPALKADPLAGFLGVRPDDPVLKQVHGMIKAGMPANAAIADVMQTLDFRKAFSAMDEQHQKVITNALTNLRTEFAPILAESDANKKQAAIDAARPMLMQWASFDPELGPAMQTLNAGNADMVGNLIGAQSEALGVKQKQQDIINATPKGAAAKAGAEAKAKLDVESSPEALALASKKATMEAQARQQAAQGNPNVAGQLLANGDLTLKDLKTRGVTPQFFEQAVLAAKQIKPTYNPADEMIAEQVANSPTHTQFFGSANSLIEKGGTLDQLAKLGKDIPQHDLPVLNTIDDWTKAASGKGPIAAYAAMALGVADDYGKVMGGGNASDHARDAALKLFGAAASPEQRDQAIAATRGAVLSQRNARIGKNQFLQRQYGSGELGGQTAKQAPAVGTVESGYRFKGGDPSKAENWEQVK